MLAPSSWNHASWPPYQIASQSPLRPATANVWPVTALSPQSQPAVVPGWPSSGSERSGLSPLGAVWRYTKVDGCGVGGAQTPPEQPVTTSVLVAKFGSIVTTRPVLSPPAGVIGEPASAIRCAQSKYGPGSQCIPGVVAAVVPGTWS